jgi:hypothetical protein
MTASNFHPSLIFVDKTKNVTFSNLQLLLQWIIINRKESAIWQHVSQSKAGVFCSWLKKIWLLKNATAYIWDWYCHQGPML